MIAITRLAILCAEKMQDFRNPRSDWRAQRFSKSVQTDWQSCKIIVGQQEGGGQGNCRLGSDHFSETSDIILSKTRTEQTTVCGCIRILVNEVKIYEVKKEQSRLHFLL